MAEPLAIDLMELFFFVFFNAYHLYGCHIIEVILNYTHHLGHGRTISIYY